jgi:hypothetical protein
MESPLSSFPVQSVEYNIAVQRSTVGWQHSTAMAMGGCHPALGRDDGEFLKEPSVQTLCLLIAPDLAWKFK